MQQLSLNLADLVVLAVIAVVVALIVRGMLRGTIKTCDPGSCSGNCGSCGSACATPRIHLSKQQLAELREIDRKAREA